MTDTPTAAAGAGGELALTEPERDVVRTAAILAGALVSRAESGFIDSFRESFAASKALRDAPAEVRELLASGGWPSLPRVRSEEELESTTMGQLEEAVQTLRAKAPGLVDGYRAMVLQSCRDVAAAADDTSGAESAVIAKVEAALT